MTRKKIVHPRIAWVDSIATLGSSGGVYALREGKKTGIEEKFTTKYSVTFVKHKDAQNLRDVPYVILTSLALFFHLVNAGYDLIITLGMPHLQGLSAFVAGKILKKPIMVKETHWYWPDTIAARMVWPISKFMALHSDMLATPGKKSREYWSKIGVCPERIVTIPYYTSILEMNHHNEILAGKLKAKFTGKIIVLYLGRLIRKKGIVHLIRAFAKLADTSHNSTLLIAGDGPTRRELEATCRSLNLRSVFFAGAVAERDKPAYFKAADIYVYPAITLRLPEEWAMGIAEAVSLGKPVIATTAVGSASDYIINGVNGYVVPERDEEALLEAMRKLVDDEILRNRMGAESRSIAQGFTYDHAVQILTATISSMLSRKEK